MLTSDLTAIGLLQVSGIVLAFSIAAAIIWHYVTSNNWDEMVKGDKNE